MNKMPLIEILKLVMSLLTPLAVVAFGLIISKNIEKAKLSVLKEKEWQVKWAEMFLKCAIEFNDNISIVICSLFSLQNETEQKKVDELINRVSISNSKLSEIDWNIRNYAQFSELSGSEVISTQAELMTMISSIISNKRGNSEEVRKLQFAYNSAVRKAHNDILNSK